MWTARLFDVVRSFFRSPVMEAHVASIALAEKNNLAVLPPARTWEEWSCAEKGLETARAKAVRLSKPALAAAGTLVLATHANTMLTTMACILAWLAAYRPGPRRYKSSG